jgi:hypothetical protein
LAGARGQKLIHQPNESQTGLQQDQYYSSYTGHIESRMNRTLTESRHVIHLIDKMKGNFGADKTKQSRLETEPEPKPEIREMERMK